MSDAPRPTRAATRRQPAKAVTRSSLTPADWICAATELLVSKSIDAVGVDALAKRLKVTRGSFYWHFVDRDDLLQQLLSSWREAQTEQVTARYMAKGASGEDILREMAGLPFHGRAAQSGASVELAIRAWARRDETARAAVDAVDARRLSSLAEVFASLGWDDSQSSARAFVLYGYMQAESLLRNQGSAAEKEERRRLVSDLLVVRGAHRRVARKTG